MYLVTFLRNPNRQRAQQRIKISVLVLLEIIISAAAVANKALIVKAKYTRDFNEYHVKHDCNPIQIM